MISFLFSLPIRNENMFHCDRKTHGWSCTSCTKNPDILKSFQSIGIWISSWNFTFDFCLIHSNVHCCVFVCVFFVYISMHPFSFVFSFGFYKKQNQFWMIHHWLFLFSLWCLCVMYVCVYVCVACNLKFVVVWFQTVAFSFHFSLIFFFVDK